MSEGYEALRHGAAWLDLSARGRFVVRGRDRARLLHNVTSNEIKKLAPGSGCYAFMLTPQGRIQADLNLFCFADHFLIDTEPELREKVPQLILKFKVADQVEIEDITGSTGAIGLEGPAAPAILASLNAPIPGDDYAHLPWGECAVANLSATGQPGFRIFHPAGKKPPLEAAGAKPADESDIRLVRIENGRPCYGEDIRETSLPQETQQMHAVSFTKGCYLGQEIVERIRSRGNVHRHLRLLELKGPLPGSLPQPGTKLALDGAEAGHITSAAELPLPGGARVFALGMIRAEAEQRNRPLTYAAGENTGTAQVVSGTPQL
jgi:aminomethyltransferase